MTGHKEAHVKEFHQAGTIDIQKMQDVRSVKPELPTFSASEGAEMSHHSREMNKQFKEK